MSKIALTPNASGTGVFTISSPATNTNRTLTLPDEAGTVLTSASSLASANLTGTVTVSGPNVGIGCTPSYRLDVASTVQIRSGESLRLQNVAGSSAATIQCSGAGGNSDLGFSTAGSERMRIDSSGNLLVGKTSANSDTAGFEANASGYTASTRDNGTVFVMDRLTSDGGILSFRKDNATVGIISAKTGDLVIHSAAAGHCGLRFTGAPEALPTDNNGDTTDNQMDLGNGATRFAVIYAGTGSINTSDRNEKQDIDVMSEAETRVAVACKGLMRKFRFIDAVAEKGDDARIHFGIIAQDLQDAFAAEGLDASRYAMFCSNTWWETDRVVPAVEAVEGAEATYDDEGNQLTEAVEAVVGVSEHTVTDHYDTLEEAPEGATERTRLGVRYSELLAFIIGAL